MSFFNVTFGIIIGVLIMTPFFFIKRPVLKYLGFALALVSVGICTYLSEKYLYPRYLGWQFEEDIRKQPLFDIVAKIHPQEFKQFVDSVKGTLRQKEDLNSVSAYSAQLMDHIFFQHLQNAPDEPIFLYLKSTLDLYRYLYTFDPRAVSKFENGDLTIKIDLTKLWEDKTFLVLLNHLLETKKLVIEESVRIPITITKDKKSDLLLDATLKELTQKFGDLVVRQTFSHANKTVPPQLAATVIIDFYSQIVSQGKENAAQIMRHLASLKTKALQKAEPQKEAEKEIKQ